MRPPSEARAPQSLRAGAMGDARSRAIRPCARARGRRQQPASKRERPPLQLVEASDTLWWARPYVRSADDQADLELAGAHRSRGKRHLLLGLLVHSGGCLLVRGVNVNTRVRYEKRTVRGTTARNTRATWFLAALGPREFMHAQRRDTRSPDASSRACMHGQRRTCHRWPRENRARRRSRRLHRQGPACCCTASPVRRTPAASRRTASRG
eukprot:4222686-Prymnesium_polylepis.1